MSISSGPRKRPTLTVALVASLLVASLGVASMATAAEPQRVDLGTPTFSNPTAVTNPLFPKSTQTQVIQLGEEAGDRLRFEVTQLAATRWVRWNEQWIQTRVTHFMAFTNGQLVEVALDFYAQADDDRPGAPAPVAAAAPAGPGGQGPGRGGRRPRHDTGHQ